MRTVLPRLLRATPPRLLTTLVAALLVSACAQGDGVTLDAQCGPTGDPVATPIHVVQGDGSTSPLQRRRVTVEGIVTAAFQSDPNDPFGRNLGGFYLRTLPGAEDADPATSEGLYVQSTLPVPVGRVVRASGTVMEDYAMTTLSAVREVVDCGVSLPVPEPVTLTLPFDTLQAPERYEGMLVTLPQALVISEYFNYDRFGEITLALPQDGFARPIEATQRFAPDDPRAEAWTEAQELRRITLDDGSNDQNRTPVRHPDGSVFTLEGRFRGGDTLTGVTGPLHYAYGRWRVHPTTPAVHTVVNPPPGSLPDVGGDLRVATMNVKNYFVDVGRTCGPDGDMDCRGADDANELHRQRAKLTAALASLQADVIGLVELQNAADDRATRDLAAALNERDGIDAWRHLPAGVMGTDAIAQGILYRSDRVTPVGMTAILDDVNFTDPRDTGLGKNRPALTAAFAPTGSTDPAFTLVVNHFKSKGSECGAGDDHPLQGSCNGTRSDAASTLLDWLETDPTGTGAPWLIVGDLNSYPMEDPMRVLLAGVDGTPGTNDDPVDLLDRDQGEAAYTFVFDGRFGRLDHAIAHPDLATRVTNTAAWPINADEVDLIDADTTYKGPTEEALYAPDAYRASDHDPILLGIDLP